MKYLSTARHLITISFAFGLVLVAIASTTTPSLAKAQASEAQETSSPSATETTRKLRERIERVVEEKKSAVQGVISGLSQRPRGFVGEVQRVSEEAITIKTRKGTQIVPYSDDVLLRRGSKTVAIGDIAVGDWVVVMGLTESDTFMPKRILISSESLRPRNHIVHLGSISGFTKTELEIIKRSDSQEFSYKITKDTEFQNQQGETVSLNDLTEDIQVLVIGYEEESGTTATVVRALAPLDKEE